MAEEQILQVEDVNNPDDSDNNTPVTNSGGDALKVYPSFYATAMANDGNPEMMRQKFPELDDSQFSLLSSKFYKDSRQETEYHTVQQGDVVGSIASQYNLYESDISKLNSGLNVNNISVGQKIAVGGTSEANLSSAIYNRDQNYTKTIQDNIAPEEKLNTIGHIETGKSAEVANGQDAYSIENSSGAMGRYQIKFDEKGPDANYRKILKEGGFNVTNKEQFLSDPKAQDYLMTHMLNNEYAKQVTQIRNKATSNSSKYSDFDIMMSIHKVGYPKTLSKLKKGGLPTGVVKNVKGERIDDEVGTYIENGRNFIKEQEYNNLLFSQENRYSKPGSKTPINYYPDGDPDLIRIGKANANSFAKTEEIANVIDTPKLSGADVLDKKLGDGIKLNAEESELLNWRNSNDFQRLQSFIKSTDISVAADVNSLFNTNLLYNESSPQEVLTDKDAVQYLGYREMFDFTLAQQITRLEEYLGSEPFERLVANIDGKDYGSLEADTESDIYSLVASKEGSGLGNQIEAQTGGRAFLSTVLMNTIEAQVKDAYSNGLINNMLPLIAGEDSFEEYDNFLQQTAERNKEQVEKNPFLVDAGTLVSGGLNMTKEAVANWNDYYTFAEKKIEETFPQAVLDGMPAVEKQELATRAADSHWWNTSGAKDDYDAIVSQNLETYDVVDPLLALETWNKRFSDLQKTGLSDGAFFGQMKEYADKLGAFTVESTPSKDGGYEMTLVPNAKNQKDFDYVQNLAYSDVEKKYPKGQITSSVEYVVKESINKNTIGLAYTALTDRKVFSTYGYEPTENEGFMSDVGSFVFDPLFMVGGAIGSGTVKLAAKGAIRFNWARGANKLRLAGFKQPQVVEAFNIYSATKLNSNPYQSALKLAGGAGAFGAFDGGQDMLRQVNSGTSFLDIDYSQSLAAGGKGMILGATVGTVGLGFNRTYNMMTQKGISKYSQMLVKPIEFGSEVSAFTLGSSVLHGTELKFQDFEETGKFLLGLKLTHGIRSAPHKILKTAKNIKNHQSLFAPDSKSRYFKSGGFSESERIQISRELGLDPKISSDKAFESLAGSPENLIKVLNSKNVDIYLKEKLNNAIFNSTANVTNSKTGDINAEAYFTTVPSKVEYSSVVNPKTKQMEYSVDMINSKGEKLSTEIFESKEAAEAYKIEAEKATDQLYSFESLIQFKKQNSQAFKELILENGFTESHLVEIFEKGIENVAPEVRKKVLDIANQAHKGAIESSNKRIENAEARYNMDKPNTMRDGDPALYGAYLRKQNKGEKLTEAEQVEFDRISNLKDKALTDIYSDVMGKEKVVETKEEAPKEKETEVKTEEAPVEGESKEGVFHGSKEPIKKVTGKEKKFTEGLGMHVGSEKAATDRNVAKDNQGKAKDAEYKEGERSITELELSNENPLRVERDFVWEGNEALEKRVRDDYQSYKKEKEQNKELGIESDYFGDYLVEKKIITEKELVESGGTPSGLRKLLLEKGFDSIEYKNQAEDKGNYSTIVLDPAKVSVKGSTPEVKLSSKKQEFTQELDKAKSEKSEDYWSVDRVVSKDLKGGKLIEVEGGYGVVTKEGDIKGVFKQPESKEKGVGDKIIQKAVEEGGRTLDNYDGYLTKIYEKNGFRVASRTPFNEQYAPEGYNKEKHGTPDIVTMVYDPLNKLNIKEKTFKGETGYDKAIEYRNSFLEQSLNEYKPASEKQKTRKKFNERIKEIRSEYKGNIDQLKEGSREKANKIKEVRSNLTEIINEANFSGPITKNLLKKAANVKNEKGLENFSKEIEKINYRNDVKNLNEDIRSLKRSVKNKLQSGEFGDAKTKAIVNDLLDVNFREIETTMGTAEGEAGLKLIQDVKLAMEQLVRPRVGAVAGKSSQAEMKTLAENANKLISDYKAKKESEKVSSQSDAVETAELVEALVKDKLSEVERFNLESGSLTGSQVRGYSAVALKIRRAQQRLNDALDAGIIESKVYEELSERIEVSSEELLGKRKEFTKSTYNEGIEYMKEVLNNFESYSEYTSEQKKLLEKVVNSEYIDKIGYSEDILVSGIDAANGYFPTNRLGELAKESMGYKHGNPLYQQIKSGLDLKPKIAQKSDTKNGADIIFRDMEYKPLAFLTGSSNSEGTGRTLDQFVITPITRSMTSAKADIDGVVQQWNKLTSGGVLSRLFSPSSPTLRRKQLNETMETLGMIMLEKQYESNGGKGSFVNRAIKENTNDYGTGDAQRLKDTYDKLPKKEVDGKEMIDWDAAYKNLSSKEKEIYDFVREKYEGELRDKQRFVNEYRGKEFQDFTDYVPLMRFGKVGMEDFKSVDFVEQISTGEGKTGVAASVGKERTTLEPSAVEFNIESLLMRSLVQTNRDFHMTPVVRESFQVIADAQNEFNKVKVESPENQSNLNTGKYLQAYKDRLQQALGVQFDMSGYQQGRITQKLSGAAYAASLNRPGRLAVESVVEYLRVGVGASTKETPNVMINQFKENLERVVGTRFEDGKIKFGKQDNTANDLMNFTDSQFRLKFNKHSINGEYDVLSGLYRNGAAKTLNDWMISMPDRATVYLAWMPTFQSQFKEVTGASFDRKAYRENPSYRKQFKEEIFDAASIADRESVKWKNTTLKGGGRSKIKLPFGSVDVNNKTLAPIVTYMSNFGALEALNFGRSARNVYFGNTPIEKANSVKQMAAQFSGGVAYGIGTSLEFLMYQQILADGETNTVKRGQMLQEIDTKRKELFSTEGIIKTSAANATFLLTSKYSQVGRNLMLLTAGALQGTTSDKDMDDLISEFTKIAYYAEPLNLEGYGPKTEVIRAAAPMYYNAIQIVMDNAEAIRNYKEAVAQEKSFTDPEARESAALFDMLVNLQRAIFMTQGTSIPFNKDVEYLSRYGISPLGVKGPTKGTERTKSYFKE